MQPNRTRLQWPGQLWRRLTEPAVSIQDVELRRKAHLLSMFLLIIIMLMVLITITRLIIIPGYIEPIPQVVGFLFLGSAYMLSRTKQYHLVAALSVSIFPGVAFVIIVNNASPNPTATLFFLILALLMGSILLSIRGTAILGLANVVMIVLLPWFAPAAFPNFGAIVTVLVANLSAAALAVISMYHRNQVENDRQATLRESESKYRLLLEQASDGIFITDQEGNYVLVNPKGCEMLGYSQDELLRLNVRDLIPPEDLAVAPRFDELRAGKMIVVERRLRCQDGTLLPMEISARMLEDGRIQAIVRDITKRKRAAEALRRSEEKYRLVVERSLQGITFLQDNRLVFVNPAICDITGYSAAELTSFSPEQFFAIVHPDDQPILFERYRTRLQDQPVSPRQEYRIVRKDGTLRWLEVFTAPVIYEDEPALLSISSDITERKRAEEALRESERRFALFMKYLPGAAFTHNDQGRVTYGNDWYFKQVGLVPEAVIGCEYRDFLSPEAYAYFWAQDQKVLSEKRACVFEDEIPRPDDPEHYLTTKFPIPKEDGTLAIGGIAINITERKQAEHALRNQEERYRIVTELISNYAYAYRVEPDGTFVHEWTTGDSFTRLTGYTPQEIGSTYKLYHPDEVDRIHRDVQATIAMRPTSGEYRIITKGGEERWLHIHRRPVWDPEQNRVVRFYGVAQDITERKRAEAALRESYSILDAIISGTTDAIFVKDLQGRYLMINAAGASFLGRIVEEVIGKDDTELFSLDTARQIMAGDRRVIAAGETQTYEEVGTAMGVTRTYLSTKGVYRDSQGNVIGLIGISRDITERKQMEEALRKSRDQLAIILGGITDGITVQDPTWRLIYANETAARIVGYPSAQALLEAPLQEVMEKFEIMDEFRQPFPRDQLPGRIALQGKPGPETLLCFREVATSEERWSIAKATPVFDEQGQVQFVVNIFHEITERKQAEMALRESEERFRQVISSISDHIYVTKVTEDGHYINTYLSPHVEILTGYPLEKFMADWNFWSSTVIHPDDRATAAAQAARLAIGQNRETEYRMIHADGRIIWVRDSARVENRDAAKIIYGVVSDITERKQLEEQLRQSQKMEAIGRLAGGVAHDLNNLLTVMTGYSDLLLDHHSDDHDPERKDIEQIKKAAERATTLIRQLLAFSRQQVLQPKVLDLNTVIAGVEKMLQRLIGEDIDLVTRLGKEIGRVKADPGQIEQVIMNLVVNARDAMPQGGKLTIETANVELSPAYTRQHLGVKPGPCVLLAVSDTGVGMDTEIQSHLFEPFFTTKEQGKGTGLGLAIVYGIVRQSGGHIWVYSEPNQGATFKIYLPQVKEASQSANLGDQVSAPSSTGSETILLVEDEEAVRELARRILLDAGYKVLEASFGQQALQISAQQEGPIHLLLTDVVMPGGMSGPQLAEHLTSLRPEIKILYMSGYTDNTIVHQGMLDSGVNLLQKPFSSNHLVRKVRDTLDSPQVSDKVRRET